MDRSVVDPDFELRRGLSSISFAPLAFLLSVISSFFSPKIRGRAPSLDPPLQVTPLLITQCPGILLRPTISNVEHIRAFSVERDVICEVNEYVYR